MTILCVDDSLETLEICKGILEAGGYNVLCTDSGLEALAVLKVHVVDAAVIDHEMPAMHGLDLAREMKLSQPELKIVMFSGSFGGHERLADIDQCISKGDGPLALRKLITELLQQ